MASSFLDSFDRNIKRVQQEVNDAVNEIAIELFLKVVQKSPSPNNPGEFAKGLLANQWYPHFGLGYSGELSEATTRDGSDSRNRISAIRGTKEFLGKDGRISLTNNVSYAYRAEYLGWPSADSPPGWHWSGRVQAYRMVGSSLSEIRAKYK